MKTLAGPAELVEKERIRLHINAQVEEFLRRGGAIEVVTVRARPTVTGAGSDWHDQEEISPCDD
jgi:hypothetical protein